MVSVMVVSVNAIKAMKEKIVHYYHVPCSALLIFPFFLLLPPVRKFVCLIMILHQLLPLLLFRFSRPLLLCRHLVQPQHQDEEFADIVMARRASVCAMLALLEKAVREVRTTSRQGLGSFLPSCIWIVCISFIFFVLSFVLAPSFFLLCSFLTWFCFIPLHLFFSFLPSFFTSFFVICVFSWFFSFSLSSL